MSPLLHSPPRISPPSFGSNPGVHSFILSPPGYAYWSLQPTNRVRFFSNSPTSGEHRFLHPEGLPSDYTISVLFRILPETPEEPFALWEILNKEGEPLVGIILDNAGKTLTFFNYDYKGDFQTVTFEGPEIERIFYGSFHKVPTLLRPNQDELARIKAVCAHRIW
ncbi:hypothetical protein NFI96_005113 [Prochilodus magdalenae]|nr:hypothetical protein NFI96_005113 [Prochilodus magdalenae]